MGRSMRTPGELEMSGGEGHDGWKVRMDSKQLPTPHLECDWASVQQCSSCFQLLNEKTGKKVANAAVELGPGVASRGGCHCYRPSMDTATTTTNSLSEKRK